MKFQPPLLTNLQRFWRFTVEPLCRLCGVQPYLLARRGPEATLRLSYVPLAREDRPPIVLLASSADVVELGRNLAQIADQMFYCVSLAFDIVNLMPQDCDIDTARGAEVVHALTEAICYAAKFSLVCWAHVGFLFMDAHHIVVLGIPTYIATAETIADDVQELMAHSLHLRQWQQHATRQPISVSVNVDRTCYVTGGGRCDSTYGGGSSDNELVYGGMVGNKSKTNKKESDSTLDEKTIVYAPGPCADPVAACIAWLLSGRRPTDNAAFAQFCSDLRTTARRWLSAAAKHGYLVSGFTVVHLADLHMRNTDDFVAEVCMPSAPVDLVTHFVYAVSCFLCLKLDVIDDLGFRKDGY
eukprot:2308000-Amphidinium_carterae.1